MRIAVLASGSGTNLQAIMEAFESGEIVGNVAVVVSNRKDAFALQRAIKRNIPAHYLSPRQYQDKEDYDRAVVSLLKKYDIELVVLAGYMRLVTPLFVRQYAGRIMNIHPSLLPAFPGTRGVEDALEYGVKVSGCTIHFVDEGLDTGPVILQAVVDIEDEDTVESLQQKIHAEEYRLYPRAISLFARNKITLKGRRCVIDE